MAIEKKSFNERNFSPKKMQKLHLFESNKFFCSVYCLELGQEQEPHVHKESDKIYAVLEGLAVASIDGEDIPLRAGEMVYAPAGVRHSVANKGPSRVALLVFAAPHTHPK